MRVCVCEGVLVSDAVCVSVSDGVAVPDAVCVSLRVCVSVCDGDWLKLPVTDCVWLSVSDCEELCVIEGLCVRDCDGVCIPEGLPLDEPDWLRETVALAVRDCEGDALWLWVDDTVAEDDWLPEPDELRVIEEDGVAVELGDAVVDGVPDELRVALCEPDTDCV